MAKMLKRTPQKAPQREICSILVEYTTYTVFAWDDSRILILNRLVSL